MFANGEEVIVNGDAVASHGTTPHNAATMVAGSTRIFVGEKAVCNAGDLATCGDAATGSTDVFAG